MAKVFLSLTRGGRPPLGLLPAVMQQHAYADPPPIFSQITQEKKMTPPPQYKDCPYYHEKLSRLKCSIKSTRQALNQLKSQTPLDPLFFQVQEQLNQGLKLWSEVTGGSLC